MLCETCNSSYGSRQLCLLRSTEITPIFSLQAYDLRGAGAVLHSHSVNAVMASLLDSKDVFEVTELEMIKVIS